MEVGEGPNWGYSAKGEEYFLKLFLTIIYLEERNSNLFRNIGTYTPTT
jgi:hypothetical protein